MKRIGVIVNPTAGKNTGARLGRTAIATLKQSGHSVLDLSAADASRARARGRAAIDAGMIDTLVVVGGDGMTHLGANICAGTDIPLGIVAVGTGNDVARTLALPVRDPAAGVRHLLGGTVRRLDLARHLTAHGEERWFIGVLGAGFDAIVNERANRWSWPKGPVRYTLAMVRELPGFRALPYRIVLDDEVLDMRAMLVAIANGPSYGGGMQVAPDARFDDGLLDVLIVRETSIPGFLKVFPRVFKGTHVGHDLTLLRRARRIRLEAPGIVTYADGERFAPLPLTVEVVPGALAVLA